MDDPLTENNTLRPKTTPVKLRRFSQVISMKKAAVHLPVWDPHRSVEFETHSLVRAQNKRTSLRGSISRWQWAKPEQDPSSIEPAIDLTEQVPTKLINTVKTDDVPKLSRTLSGVYRQSTSTVHQKVDAIFKCLEMPYADRFQMLERFSLLTDAQQFEEQVDLLEKAAKCIALHEKLHVCASEIRCGCVFLAKKLPLSSAEHSFLKRHLTRLVQCPPLRGTDIAPIREWVRINQQYLFTSFITMRTKNIPFSSTKILYDK